MNRKQKIEQIRAGIKPEKIQRYAIWAFENEDGTYEVNGRDLINKTDIKGIYTKDELYQLEKGDQRYYALSFHIIGIDSPVDKAQKNNETFIDFSQ